MTHTLKCLRRFYEPLLSGMKAFEIRKDDRGFTEGDVLELQEWEPNGGGMCDGFYTQRQPLFFRVTYCLREEPFVPRGYVCMGIKPCKEPKE